MCKDTKTSITLAMVGVGLYSNRDHVGIGLPGPELSATFRSALPSHQSSPPDEHLHFVWHRAVRPTPPGVTSPPSPSPVVPIPYVGTVLDSFETAGSNKRAHSGMGTHTQLALRQLQPDLDWGIRLDQSEYPQVPLHGGPDESLLYISVPTTQTYWIILSQCGCAIQPVKERQWHTTRTSTLRCPHPRPRVAKDPYQGVFDQSTRTRATCNRTANLSPR